MENNINKIRESFGARLLTDVSLSQYCQFGTGGKAKFLIRVDKIEDLILVVLLAQNNNIPYRVIGFGGALLFSDGGYDGLVIVNRANRMIHVAQSNKIICDSGTTIAELINFAAEKGLGGIEKLYQNYGTIGGTIYNNGCSNNIQIGDYIESATLLTDKGKIVSKRPDWFEFGPRKTRLMQYNKNRPWVILTAMFQMQSRRNEEICNDICRIQLTNKSNKATGYLFDVFADNDTRNNIDKVLEMSKPRDIIIGGAELDRNILNCIRKRKNATSADARKLIESLLETINDNRKADIKETIEYFGSWH